MKNRAPIAAVLLILFLSGCGHTLTREEAEKKLKENLEQTEQDITADIGIGRLNFGFHGIEAEPDAAIDDNTLGENPDLDRLVNHGILSGTVVKTISSELTISECYLLKLASIDVNEWKLTKYKLNTDMPAEAKDNIIQIYDEGDRKLMKVKLGKLSKVKCTGLVQEPNSNTCSAEFEVDYEPTIFASMGFQFQSGFSSTAHTIKKSVTFTRYDDGWRM